MYSAVSVRKKGSLHLVCPIQARLFPPCILSSFAWLSFKVSLTKFSFPLTGSFTSLMENEESQEPSSTLTTPQEL